MAQGDQSPEGAVKALITMMTDDLPALLDAEDDGDITLQNILKYYRAPGLMDYDGFPAASVFAEGTKIPDRYRHDQIRTHRVILQFWEQSNQVYSGLLPQEVLYYKLYRSGKALYNLIQNNTTLTVSGTDNAHHAFVDEVQYSVPFQRRKQEDLMQGLQIVLRLDFS